MLTSGAITVVPDAVRFENVEPGNSYSQDIFIHNVGKKPVRVRYILPFDQNFVLLGNSNLMLPPGLETKVSIRYFCRSTENHRTELKIQSPDGSVALPIEASPESVGIQFDAKFVDFGTVSSGSETKKSLKLINRGKKSGNFVIKATTPLVKLSPSSGSIEGGGIISVELIFKPKKIGVLDGTVTATLDGNVTTAPVTLKGNVIENEVVLVVDGSESRDLNFGSIYYGQKKVMEVTVKNKSAVKRSFVVVPPHDADVANLLAGMTRVPTISDPDILFTVSPCEGVLKPFGTAQLTVVFSPPSPEDTNSSEERMFNQLSAISIIETQHSMDFQLSGNASQVRYDVNALNFDFGRQKVNTKEQKTLTIENKSLLLPITFAIKKIAHFHFTPETGTIKPKEKKSVVVCFQPKNMGDFNVSAVVDVCHGLSKTRLSLTGVGVARDVEPKKFERPKLWESKATEIYNIEYPNNRFGLSSGELIQKAKLRDEFDGYITDSAEQRAKREEEKNRVRTATKNAQSFIEQSGIEMTADNLRRYIKTEIQKMEPNDDMGTNLGFGHCEGMKPPGGVLPKGQGHLIVPEPKRLGLLPTTPRSGNDAKRNLASTGSVSAGKRFKPAPTTAPESLECSKTLSPTDLTSISASHQTINFGSIPVFSEERRVFELTNDLDQHILVKMEFEKEFSKSSPTSQVIPPRQTAIFDIVFSANEQKKYMKPISYVINNTHRFGVNVCAQIVGIDVSLSKRSIEFTFPEGFTKTFVQEQIKVINNSKAFVHYQWSSLSPAFAIHPEKGRISPNSFDIAEVTYTPGTSSSAECTAVLNVVGGKSSTLKLSGNIGSPNLILNSNLVSFGMLPVLTTKYQSITMRNVGDSDAIYAIESHDGCVSVTPTSGRLAPGENAELDVCVYSNEPGHIEEVISINVCGTQPIKLKVRAEVEAPSVNIAHPDTNYEKVFIGGSEVKKLSFRNTGSTTAIMFVNLLEHPDFRFEIPAQYGLSAENDTSSSVLIVTDMNPSLEKSAEELAINETSSVYGTGAITLNHKIGLIYKITVIPGDCVDVNLIFQPKKVGVYDFYLPISLFHVDDFDPNIMIRAEAIHSPLLPSESSLDFGVTPLFNSENPKTSRAERQITLKNESRLPVNFRLTSSNPCFVVTPNCGRVDYGAKKSVKISFRPTEAIPYCTFLPLYATTEEGEVIVAKIHVIGVGSARRFQTSTDYVCLPTVPLGIRTEKVIDILNVSLVRTTLTAKIPVSEKNFPLEISFPSGPKLDYTTTKLPLKISFASHRPLSFTTVIAIVDSEGSSYSFTVTATTDNSVFTLYPFLTNNDYHITGEQATPITLTLDCDSVANDFLADFLSQADIVNAARLKPANDPVLVSFITKFLNSLVLTKPIDIFPDDLVKTQGRCIFEMIENMTGRKIQSSQIYRPPTYGMRTTTTSVKDMSMREKMKMILQYLMAQGAHLASIKPEFLLSANDFIDHYRQEITRKLLGLDYYGAPEVSSLDPKLMSEYTASHLFSTALTKRLRIVEQLYFDISRESWTLVVLQICKVFMESKIRYELFNQVPGVSAALDSLKKMKLGKSFDEINRNTKILSASNVFNAVECTLLKWMTVHYCKMNPTNMAVFFDFIELRDPLVLLALFKSHLPRAKFDMIEEMADYTQMKKNMEQIARFMQHIKVNLAPTAQEILNGSGCTLALLALQLYQVLPHFYPSGVLEFNVMLSRIQTQSVTITNPSKREITYHAAIEGSPDFTVVKDVITLKAEESAEFDVRYFARRHSPCGATLTLIPDRPKPALTSTNEEKLPQTARRPKNLAVPFQKPEKKADSTRKVTNNPVTATTIVVEMTAETNIKESFEVINVESPIYEVEKLHIPVKNACKRRGKYKVYVRYFHLADENNRRIGPKFDKEVEVLRFLDDPAAEPEYPTATTPFVSIIQQHQAFLVSSNSIEFHDDENGCDLDVEFVPVSLGSYLCLLLFVDKTGGEFLYEISAKATFPKPFMVDCDLKVEVEKTISSKFDLDPANSKLCEALAYSVTSLSAHNSYVSARKFLELVGFHAKEITAKFLEAFVSTAFRVECSMPEFFQVQTAFTNHKSENGKSGDSFPVTFTPKQAGEYPCRIVFMSDYDVRCYQVNGIALAPTQDLELEFKTIIGKPVMQNLPFSNPSKNVWNFRASVNGDIEFNISSRFSVHANTCSEIPLTFNPRRAGDYRAQLVITNVSKEVVVKYELHGVAEEPPAESKIVITCKARESKREIIELPSFLDDGIVTVQSYVPVLEAPERVEFRNGRVTRPFEVTVFSLRSGVSAGQLKFCDTSSNKYFWFVIEVNVERPDPEEIIDVSTIARQSVTVKIPVHNPRTKQVVFDVLLSHDDLFGAKQVKIASRATEIYELVFSPLHAIDRTSYASFINDDDGEFVYQLNCVADPANVNTCAPMSSVIGEHASTDILIENPLDKRVTFRIENENNECFQVISKPILQLGPKEKKSIEVKYLPTIIGTQQTSMLTLKSREVGEWYYKLVGTGRPPQPQSPIIVECSLDSPASGYIEFTNPFCVMSKFNVSISSNGDECFEFLTKRNVFTLSGYGSAHHIAFAFRPPREGTFSGNIVIATSGKESIQWVYPIIGKATASGKKQIPRITGRANQDIEKIFQFPLDAERESYGKDSYTITVEYPSDSLWMSKILKTRILSAEANATGVDLKTLIRILPRRPIDKTVTIVITNSFGQKWTFPIAVKVERGEPSQVVTIEGNLKETIVSSVFVNESFAARTAFHAYFAIGSAPELSVRPGQGYISPSMSTPVELPFDILFQPTVYGKPMRGLLVVDTLEVQYLFDVVGTIPEYKPPSGLTSTFSTRGATSEIGQRKKRNPIRDNIRNVKTRTGPRVTVERKRPFVS